ncbi:MAG TPA: YwgA family protein [Bacillales bacterium]|nr:YwgA family protein [Bacillales bacterium]
MLEDHAKLMAVLQHAGEIAGRKKLQKIIFIAKKLKYPFHEKYHYHFYGPYSEELTLRVEELCNLGFLTERKETKSGYAQYCYSLTAEGEKFLHHYDVDMPGLDACIASLNSQNARFLELVSTVLHFGHLDRGDVEEKVFRLKRKQRYTKEDLDRAYTYFEKLRKQCV